MTDKKKKPRIRRCPRCDGVVSSQYVDPDTLRWCNCPDWEHDFRLGY